MGPDGQSERVEAAVRACLELLGARDRTRHELALALERKGFCEAEREAALARVEGFGYLDDARFARERAEHLLGSGRLAPAAVRARLGRHGLGEEAARGAVQEAQAALGFDPLAAAREALGRRGLLDRPLDPRAHARAARFLLGRGFDEEVVARVLGEPALDPPGADD